MIFFSKKRVTAILPVLTLAIFLLLPEIARAETLQGTLQSNDAIKNLHNGLMNIINFPIILVVVAMAFAEMFRFKIDTYGLKKILPTLLLAIIGAQFSYLICKLIIDLANMTLLLFLDPKLLGDASGLPAKYATTFGKNLFANPPVWSKFTYSTFFTDLLQVLFLLAGSIAILILCFLFLIRSWMVYLLVIVSGLGFMALAFPPTKPYFNKWWTEFFKWTFLPVPSVFFLWLGALFLGNPIITSSWLPIPFMSAIIAILCLVFAITVPLKMGGPVMAGFLKYSGANWGLNKAKTKWVDPWVDDAKRRVGNWYASKASSTPAIRAKEKEEIDAAIQRGASQEEIKAIQDRAQRAVKRGTQWWANPLGTIRRRSLRVGWDREKRKKEEEGWIDQGTREALGGKEGEYLDAKRRLKRGEWAENIATLFGEKDWAEKRLKRQYFQSQIDETKNNHTEVEKVEAEKLVEEAKEAKEARLDTAVAAGATDEEAAMIEKEEDQKIAILDNRANAMREGYSMSALNSAQFAMRVKADDLAITNMVNIATAMAHRGDPNFLHIKQWDDVYKDLAGQTAYLTTTERTKNKATSDFEREAQAVPIKLNEEIEGFQRAVKTFDEATKKLTKATADGADEKIIRDLEEQVRIAKNMKIVSENGFKAQIEAIKNIPRYFDQSTGKLKGIAAATMSGMILDGSGNIITDVSQAKSMNQINAIPSSIAGLYRDRTGKTLSDVVKNEIASEREKRTAIESARLLRDELAKEFKLVAAGRGNELSAEKFWKVTAAANNALSVGDTSPEYTEVQKILNTINVESAMAGDIHVRNDMAKENETALSYLVNNNKEAQGEVHKSMAKFLQGSKFGTELAGLEGKELLDKVDEFRKKSSSAINKEIDELLATSEDFQNQLKDSLVTYIARETPIVGEKLQRMASVKMGVDGQVDFDLTGGKSYGEDGYQENVEFLAEVQRINSQASIRGLGEYLRRGAAVAKKTSIIYASLNRQAGKSMDMSRGLDGVRFKPDKEFSQYGIGDLGYDPAGLRGYYGDERFESLFLR